MALHIGIDIGARAVKAAALRASFKKTRLEALIVVEITEPGGVAEALRRAIAEATLGKPAAHDGVAVAIDGDRAAVRVLALPMSAQKQLGEVLPFELESEVPFDIAESVWDYRVLTTGRPELAKATELAVLVAVARTEEARARIDLLKSAILQEPERVGVGAFPLANLCLGIPELASSVEPIMLVDLGTKRSEVLVVKGGEPVFSRTVTVGTEGLPGTASKLARELRTTIASYRATGGAAPRKVLLAGGGASFISGAEGFISQEVNLPVETIPRPASFELAPTITQQSLATFPQFAKAVGLAMSLGSRPVDVNLRKGPLAFERGFAWVKEKVPALVGLGAVIALAFFLSVVVELIALSRERATLEKAMTNVTGEVLGEATPSADRANELLQQQTALSDEDPLPHADSFDVMVRLSESIPQSVVHDIDELDVQKGHVVVHGVVASVNDAQEIAKSLKSERCFSDVKITRTTQVVGGDRQKYVMEFDIKCPEDVKAVAKKPGAAAAPTATATATGGK
jgi:general secretion pathway protein L